MPFTVNTGVRMEDTHFSSDGAAQTILSAVPNGGGQNIVTVSPGSADRFRRSLHGHSADNEREVGCHRQAAGALRGIARHDPSNSDGLVTAQTILTNPGNEQITHGNPDLKPFRAFTGEVGARMVR